MDKTALAELVLHPFVLHPYWGVPTVSVERSTC